MMRKDRTKPGSGNVATVENCLRSRGILRNRLELYAASAFLALNLLLSSLIAGYVPEWDEKAAA
jgi:hypothetical protein